MAQSSYIPSNNGLQSYIDAAPSYELAPIGIASMQDQAQKLAEMGRNGDIYVVHAAEGETVIPMEVLEANPQIKALLFNQMTEMGLDPQRYVVGDKLNSLNPVTGMPEFFFKSIFKGIKKAVKSVVKVVKKIAPVALPIIGATIGIPFLGAAFLPGSMASMALTSGIGTLIGGGSLKDAFKSALIAGGTAGITGALKGATPSSWGFGGTGTMAGGIEGFKKAALGGYYTPPSSLPIPTSPAIRNVIGEQTIANPLSGLSTSPSDSRAALARQSISAIDAGPVTPTTPLPDANVAQPLYPNVSGPVTIAGGGVRQPALDSFSVGKNPGAAMVRPPLRVSSDLSAPSPELDPTPPGFWDKTGDILFRGGKPQSVWDDAQTKAYDAARAKGHPIWRAEEIAKAAGPNVLQRWGPTVAAAGLGVYGLGAFDVAEQEEITEEDRPDIGGGRVLTLAERQAAAREQELQQASLDPLRFIPSPDVERSTIFSAAGGSVEYPRRELLVEGPGTEKSDDIPAMLSDGEFVINSKAVRGADPSGRGDRYAGAQNLYNLMRNFEMRA